MDQREERRGDKVIVGTVGAYFLWKAFGPEIKKLIEATVESFAQEVEVSETTVHAWLYRNQRPDNGHLRKIAEVLTRRSPADEQKVLAQLRRHYFLSGMAHRLAGVIGESAVLDCATHLYRYAEVVSLRLLEGSRPSQFRTQCHQLLLIGVNATVAHDLVAHMMTSEKDKLWQESLSWATRDWVRAIQISNHRLHHEEAKEAIRQSGGALLKAWGVTRPESYRTYQKSLELAVAGEQEKALALVRRAIKEDPTDPVPHLTLGSILGGMGNRLGDRTMVEQALNECRIALELAPWELTPKVEIGWILLEAGRTADSLSHPRSIDATGHEPNGNYFAALAVANRESGNYDEALRLFEQAIWTDPERAEHLTAAAECAALLGSWHKARRYAKQAKSRGRPEVFELLNLTRRPPSKQR